MLDIGCWILAVGGSGHWTNSMLGPLFQQPTSNSQHPTANIQHPDIEITKELSE
jgi:hypothetical protein